MTGAAARLESRLPVDTEMDAVAQKTHTCGVGVDAVQIDCSVLCRVAQKGYALVGVGQVAACGGREGCGEQCHRKKELFHDLR